MYLTLNEKKKIFWALVERYPEHEKGRKQAKKFFSGSVLKAHIAEVNIAEKKAYRLLKKFAKEIGETLPPYLEVKES
jgi:hypothetical protein